jgi:hypothetical protein
MCSVYVVMRLKKLKVTVKNARFPRSEKAGETREAIV